LPGTHQLTIQCHMLASLLEHLNRCTILGPMGFHAHNSGSNAKKKRHRAETLHHTQFLKPSK
jgi:hypothetical protein